ncbi:hypothetical protein [Oleiagrimonas sp.]|jgi:uncharacterized protein|uniref:hypothetical protein n=1 Tax=Oleiagrimonas sp. TaxID=2010330 RepID=UPI0026317330|nr:hypothetical protein [Oleiagrimonas sp.]MDA3914893.1 hypothetical protein [Oleiagrimonas sp.]
MIWRFCVTGLLLLASSALHAAGMDCKASRDAVQKMICTHLELRRLDHEMSVQLARERHVYGVDAEILRRDQALWHRGFLDRAWSFLSDPGRSAYAPQAIGRMYQNRIDFLAGLNAVATSRFGDSVAHALVAEVQSLPANGEDVVTALRKQAGPFDWPIWRVLSGKSAFIAALPTKSSADINHVLRDLGLLWSPGAPVNFARLPHAGFVVADTVEGTMDCQNWTMFLLGEDAVLHPVPVPEVFRDTCWNRHGSIARLAQRVVAISETNAILDTATDLELQVWGGSRWGRPTAIRVRYDYKLIVDFFSCDAKSLCAKVRSQALRDAMRYDARPLPASLTGGILRTTQQRARYRRMRRLARHAKSVRRLPELAGLSYASLDGYGSEATYFPMLIEGKLLLGRIGHGHIGWREGDNWLVGLWKLDGGHLVPLAGVVVVRKRTRMTLISRIRVKPPGRHRPGV